MEQHEGNVGEYLQSQRSTTTYNNHIGSIGDGANVQLGNAQATQNIGISPAELQQFVEMLRPQLGAFGDSEAEATAALDEVAEEAAASHPDRGRVVRALRKLAELALPASARMVGEFVRYKLQAWGLLPPSATLPTNP